MQTLPSFGAAELRSTSAPAFTGRCVQLVHVPAMRLPACQIRHTHCGCTVQLLSLAIYMLQGAQRRYARRSTTPPMVCQLNARDIKLIATDVDGTLLNHKQELTERTARAFQTAASLGIKVRCSLFHRNHTTCAYMMECRQAWRLNDCGLDRCLLVIRGWWRPARRRGHGQRSSHGWGHPWLASSHRCARGRVTTACSVLTCMFVCVPL